MTTEAQSRIQFTYFRLLLTCEPAELKVVAYSYVEKNFVVRFVPRIITHFEVFDMLWRRGAYLRATLRPHQAT